MSDGDWAFWDDDPSCPECWDTLNGAHVCKPEHLDHVRRYHRLLSPILRPVNDEPCMCGTPFTCMADEHPGFSPI